MTTPSTYYTGRSALPDFIVRGADTVLSMSLYLDGAKVAVSSATLTVYNDAGTAILSAVSASIASNTALATRKTLNSSRSRRSGKACANRTPKLMLSNPPTASGRPSDQLT